LDCFLVYLAVRRSNQIIIRYRLDNYLIQLNDSIKKDLKK
jgi:hypothetical protein